MNLNQIFKKKIVTGVFLLNSCNFLLFEGFGNWKKESIYKELVSQKSTGAADMRDFEDNWNSGELIDWRYYYVLGDVPIKDPKLRRVKLIERDSNTIWIETLSLSALSFLFPYTSLGLTSVNLIKNAVNLFGGEGVASNESYLKIQETVQMKTPALFLFAVGGNLKFWL